MAKQAAEKAGGLGRLRWSLLHRHHLLLCLVERDVLHQDRLRQHVQRIWVASQSIAQKAFRAVVLFIEPGCC